MEAVAFFNCSSILIVAEALRSENKFQEPRWPVVLVCFRVPSITGTDVSGDGRAFDGIKHCSTAYCPPGELLPVQ